MLFYSNILKKIKKKYSSFLKLFQSFTFYRVCVSLFFYLNFWTSSFFPFLQQVKKQIKVVPVFQLTRASTFGGLLRNISMIFSGVSHKPHPTDWIVPKKKELMAALNREYFEYSRERLFRKGFSWEEIIYIENRLSAERDPTAKPFWERPASEQQDILEELKYLITILHEPKNYRAFDAILWSWRTNHRLGNYYSRKNRINYIDILFNDPRFFWHSYDYTVKGILKYFTNILKDYTKIFQTEWRVQLANFRRYHIPTFKADSVVEDVNSLNDHIWSLYQNITDWAFFMGEKWSPYMELLVVFFGLIFFAIWYRFYFKHYFWWKVDAYRTYMEHRDYWYPLSQEELVELVKYSRLTLFDIKNDVPEELPPGAQEDIDQYRNVHWELRYPPEEKKMFADDVIIQRQVAEYDILKQEVEDPFVPEWLSLGVYNFFFQLDEKKSYIFKNYPFAFLTALSCIIMLGLLFYIFV